MSTCFFLIGCGASTGISVGDDTHIDAGADTGIDAAIDAAIDAGIDTGPTPIEPSYEPVVSIAAGLFHSCAATRAGRVHCWGFNNQGQLGDGTRETRLNPTVIRGIDEAIDVTAGRSHSCALHRAGVATCWGSNLDGQIGDGFVAVSLPTPTRVVPTERVVQIDAGGDHTCALVGEGRVLCWGSNARGQLGGHMDPVDVPTGARILEISAGFTHTCARSSTRVMCWGDGIRLDSTPAPSSIVPGLPAVVQMSSGDFETCAVDERGDVWCWGFGMVGEVAHVLPANRVEGLHDVVAVRVGHEFRCARHRDAHVSCWGNNGRGQLGDGGVNEVPGAFISPIGLPPATAVIAGWRHACALTTEGITWCWGRNWEGQLGIGVGGEHRPPAVASVLRGL